MENEYYCCITNNYLGNRKYRYIVLLMNRNVKKCGEKMLSQFQRVNKIYSKKLLPVQCAQEADNRKVLLNWISRFI